MALIEEDNPNHYCVATQDEGLKAKLRVIPGVSERLVVTGYGL